VDGILQNRIDVAGVVGHGDQPDIRRLPDVMMIDLRRRYLELPSVTPGR
jgi:hypothetical protein